MHYKPKRKQAKAAVHMELPLCYLEINYFNFRGL